jgi:hypothetical protein
VIRIRLMPTPRLSSMRDVPSQRPSGRTKSSSGMRAAAGKLLSE